MGQGYITGRERKEIMDEQLGIYPSGTDGRPEGDVTVIDKVVTLATNIFRNNKNVINISLSSNLKEIQDYAFENCSNLLSVPLPNSLTKIGKYVFSGCTSLTKIELPLSIEEIAEYGFGGSNITDMVIPFGFAPKLWNEAFRDNKSIKNLEIDCQSMSKNCFFNCKSLQTIHFGGHVRDVTETAFRQCINIHTITFEEGLKNIYSSAFNGCSALKSIDFPASIRLIDYSAFYGCSVLSNVTFKNGIQTIGYQAFRNCSMTSINLPKSITSINFQAFYGNPQLKDIYIDKIKDSISGAPWGATNATVHWREAYLNFSCNEDCEIYVAGQKINNNKYIFSPNEEGNTITYTAYNKDYSPVTKTIFIPYNADKKDYNENIIFTTTENDCLVSINVVDNDNNSLQDVTIKISYEDFSCYSNSCVVLKNTLISYQISKKDYLTINGTKEVTEDCTITEVMSLNKINDIIIEYPFNLYTEYWNNLTVQQDYVLSPFLDYPNTLMSNFQGEKFYSKNYIKLRTSANPFSITTLKIKGVLEGYGNPQDALLITIGTTIYAPGVNGTSMSLDYNIPSNQKRLYYKSTGSEEKIEIEEQLNLLPNKDYYINIIHYTAKVPVAGREYCSRVYFNSISFQSAPLPEDTSLPVIGGEKQTIYDALGTTNPYINSKFFKEGIDLIIEKVGNINYQGVDSYLDNKTLSKCNRLYKSYSLSNSNGENTDAALGRLIKMIDFNSNTLIDLSNFTQIKISGYIFHNANSSLECGAYMRLALEDDISLPQSSIPYDWTDWDVLFRASVGTGVNPFFTLTKDISDLKENRFLYFGVFHGNELSGNTVSLMITEIELI